MTGRRKKLRKQFHKLMQRKLVMLYVAIILAFVILIGRIVFINAVNGDKYTKIVLDQQQFNSREIPFKRGDIVDRNGTKMATSERIYNVILDAKVMLANDGKCVEPTIEVLKSCFGINEGEVRKVLENEPNSHYYILKKGVDYKTAKKFKKIDADNEKYPNISGVWLEDDYVRTYPYNTLACDVIGFTYSGNAGSNGIEAAYNSLLNGTNGKEYGYVEDVSTVERIVKEPENGKTIVSTIDVQVQSIVEKYILEFNQKHKNQVRKGEGSKNTAVIVMNPQNGEILAEACYPNYDLNNPRDLTAYHDAQTLKTMSDKETIDELNELWNNFCVSSTFEPGSTIKPFSIATGLETGALTGEESYNCGGVLHVGDHDIHCSHRNGHGVQTLKQSLENSCNVALMRIGQSIGKEDFCRYQHLFGFGEYTGIDLPGEATTEGLLYNADNMDVASLATNAFGQNFNVTMTQLAAGFCSLINGGEYYKPHIVKEIRDENGNVTQSMDPLLVRRTISEETCELVKDYMRGVVVEGTAVPAGVEGYDVGGKTGTAEKWPRNKVNYLVSFIGYAPQDNPQVMVYVVIDEPNAGDQANSGFATEMSSKIMKEIFPYLGVKRIDEGDDQTQDKEENITSDEEE